jgi:Transposase DDE domain
MLDRSDELYYILDLFCKQFEAQFKKISLNHPTKKRRKRATILTLAEMMTILIMYQSSNFKNFKSFYFFLKRDMKSAFNKLCSYNRFIELAPRCCLPLSVLLHILFVSCNGISIVDSTALKVCHIKREKRHKTFKGIAQKSKGTMGWFFGFKLHVIVNQKGELMDAKLDSARVDDREVLSKMCHNLFGDLIGDRGYIGKEFKETLKNMGINLITRGRKNMKTYVLTEREEGLLKQRNTIETVIGKLKIKFNIEHTRHRSMMGFMINMLCALIAYCFCEHSQNTSQNLQKQTVLNQEPLLNAA